eukprot:11994227-Ditylum_brightwellii.AAC.1
MILEPLKCIAKQVQIIGSSAESIAEYISDIGHVIKVPSNKLYYIQEIGPLFKVEDLFENGHNRAIMGNAMSSLRFYSHHIGDE